MADDAGSRTIPETTEDAVVCPWCSAQLPAADATVCPTCEAHLVGSDGVDILGVTTVDPFITASSSAPRRVRVLGSLFAGDNDDMVPSPEELPALAPPDVEVRREMLRLEMDARLAALQSEVKAMEVEQGSSLAPPSEPPEEPADETPGEPAMVAPDTSPGVPAEVPPDASLAVPPGEPPAES
jgi:hypothetical protein